jgi:hypothetical protein
MEKGCKDPGCDKPIADGYTNYCSEHLRAIKGGSTGTIPSAIPRPKQPIV